MTATRESLIKDIQRLNKTSAVTRNFYRANGVFSESDWQKFFPTFVEFKKAANIQQTLEPEVNEITEDKWVITLPKTNIHTLEQLIEYCKIDLAVWEVEKFVANKWDMNAGGGETVELFQIKAFLKKKIAIVNASLEIENLKKIAKENSTHKVKISITSEPTGNMLEINIPDAHIGKMSWGIETGYGNYDVKIAQAVFMRALDSLISRTKGYKFDEILFVVGNDLFNSDDLEGRTTKGTFVSTDGRYHKTFFRVRTMMIQAVEKLRTIAPVKVVMVSGNHDVLTVWHLGDSLECYFHNYDDVIIDNAPSYRKYHQFGKVMLMFTHGDKAKRSDYPLLMATEQPEMFGSTKFREAHTGHTHMTKVDEQHGIRVRVLPSLCQPDDWLAENGLVGNLRNAEAYVWNKNEGLIGMAIYSDDAQDQIETQQSIVKK